MYIEYYSNNNTLICMNNTQIVCILMFRFKNIPDELDIIKFSSKKITDLGFKFKYSLEDMFTGAVETCREKGLLPKPEETTVNNELLPKPAETTVNDTMQK